MPRTVKRKTFVAYFPKPSQKNFEWYRAFTKQSYSSIIVKAVDRFILSEKRRIKKQKILNGEIKI